MQRSPSQLRTIATAMLIMGLFVEIVGVALLAMDRSTSAALAVMSSGLLLVMLGVNFLSQSRR